MCATHNIKVNRIKQLHSLLIHYPPRMSTKISRLDDTISILHLQHGTSYPALVNPNPFASPYLSINLMNRSHSAGLFNINTLSIDCGLPFTNEALTDVVPISPSSSTRNIPVTSPDEVVDASKTLGLENLKVAVPDDPSRARVNLISGITFSSRPRMN